MQRLLTFRVDLLKDEFDVAIKIPIDIENENSIFEIKFGNNNKKIVNSDCLNLSGMLHKIMEFFVIERDAGLDSDLTSPNTPSGIFDWNNVPQHDEHGYETIDENSLLEEDNSVFGIHSAITNLIYGQDISTSIKNANTVRISIQGNHIYESRKKFYNIGDKDRVVITLRFADDYTKNSQPPTVSAKSSSETQAFCEQVQNISRYFVESRWKEYHQDTIPLLFKKDDPKFSFLSEYNSINDSLLRYIVSFIKTGETQFAMAVSLWANKMNILNSIDTYVQCGGIVTDLQRSIIQNLLSMDKYQNIVLEIITYLILRIFDLSNVCAICDRRIEVGKPNSMKGQICTSFKCQFDYISLKVCASLPMRICPTIISQDIMDNQDIVDILINMCYAAAKSDRRDLIFEPFPQFYVNNNIRDYNRVIQTLDSLPDIATMVKHCDNELSLKRLLGAESYELTKWILTTKRVAMFKMSKDKAIKEMLTEYQFMMLVDDPKVTKKFNENKKKYGSYVAFHGTAFENLHSVTRRRLIVASGTSLQTTGSAYGKGIYLSENSTTSLGYSRPGISWPKSRFGTKNNLKCMFICEVVKLEGVPTVPNPYYVVDNAEAVSIRFFLFYPDSISVNVISHNLGLEKYMNY